MVNLPTALAPSQSDELDSSPADAATPLWQQHAAVAARTLVDMVLPPRCYECGAVVAGAPGFCPDCWPMLDFLAGPACARCDIPLPQEQGEGALCGECMTQPPPYHRVLAPLAYGPAARDVVMRFKYGRRIATAQMMVRLMRSLVMPLAGQSTEQYGRPPLLVPVPLYRWRLWWRGFNQAAILAQHLSRALDLPLGIDALRRTRSTGSMRGRGRRARARQVRGAFALAPGGASLIKDRHILLVDDVFTTGATAASCTRVLLAGGAAQVSVVAFARAVSGRGDVATLPDEAVL